MRSIGPPLRLPRQHYEMHTWKEYQIANCNTASMMQAIRADFPNRHLIVFPDPSGRARHTTSANVGETDHTIIQSVGADIYIPQFRTNSDKYNTVNGPFDFLGEQERIQDLIQKYAPNFMVLSTLQNLLRGRDWNRQEDMQPIMAATILLARLSPLFLITHSPWDKRQKRAAGTVTQAANFLTAMHYEKRENRRSGETFVHVSLDSKAGAYETDFSLSRLRKNAVESENSLVSTVRTDKKKACAEKTSNSWTCSATSAPSSEFRRTIRCVRCVP